MFQTCPKCMGVGKVQPNVPSGTTLSLSLVTCPVCKGEMIISQETGLPPSSHGLVISSIKKERKMSPDIPELIDITLKEWYKELSLEDKKFFDLKFQKAIENNLVYEVITWMESALKDTEMTTLQALDCALYEWDC